LRWLQTAFNNLIPTEKAELTLYPEHLRQRIDTIADWMSSDLNTGVYKAGFASDEETYIKNIPPVFGALNKLEKLLHTGRGPYVLGTQMTELDVLLYATLIRFDPVYVQHFVCIPFSMPISTLLTGVATKTEMQSRYHTPRLSRPEQLAQRHVLEP
jgi:putative glutathione S-transferase